jgi:prepilin-type N-terminal cleavage/methylation domain-containing protein
MTSVDPRTSGESGFSLVEVSLALLVAGIGLLAVFALFPSGLDLNKKAIDETQLSMFAEEVFNGYRTLAASGSFGSLETETIGPAAPHIWKNYGADISIKAGSGSVSYMALDAPVEEYAFRYELDIGQSPISEHIKYLALRLWSGEFTTGAKPADYYTEIYDTNLE